MGFLSSYFFRLAICVAALPVIIMGLALSWSYTSTKAQLRAGQVTVINDDIAALVEIYTNDGQSGIISSIENRLKLIPKTRARAHYALIDKQGQKLAGNLSGPVIGNTNYIQFIDWKDDRALPMIVRSTPLRGGEVLHVARNDEIRQTTLAGLRKVFTFMALATLGFGVLAGVFAAHIFKRRLKAVNDTCTQIANGHMDARVLGPETGDEFGVLSGNVNTMLERIGKLITLRKNITDQVAHELRSPLTRLDASLVKAAITAKNPKEIDDARIEITNCISLLDALLDVSALEAQGGDKSGFESVDLSELAMQMTEFYQGLAEEKNIVLSSEILGGVTLGGDAMQLSRLVANLLDNAIKYTPVGGRVNITVTKGPVITVRDNGLGVPAHLRTSIFTPFFRDPGLKTRRGQNVMGHGLGLALCQAIAKRHGMKIRVEDADPGAKFIVS